MCREPFLKQHFLLFNGQKFSLNILDQENKILGSNLQEMSKKWASFCLEKIKGVKKNRLHLSFGLSDHCNHREIQIKVPRSQHLL